MNDRIDLESTLIVDKILEDNILETHSVNNDIVSSIKNIDVITTQSIPIQPTKTPDIILDTNISKLQYNKSFQKRTNS